MNKTTPLTFAALGLTLVFVGILLERVPLLDEIANISFPYLAGMLGLAVLVVGIHCILFGVGPSKLPLVPNLILFFIIAGAANVNIVWDGVALGKSEADIWLNLSNSLEFALYYAVFLFLPRWKRKTSALPGCETDSPSANYDGCDK